VAVFQQQNTEKHVRYQQPRDSSRAREPIVFASPMMMLTPRGLMLGAGTILVAAEATRKLKSLKGREQAVLALLSAAYGSAVEPSVLSNIERAAKSWAEGDDFTAHIHLAHTGLRALDDLPSAAYRLRMAKGVLDHGGSPRSVFEALRVDARYIDTLEKRYNPAQPRVPAGHPDGGEWTTTYAGTPSLTSGNSMHVQSAAPRQYAALEADSNTPQADVVGVGSVLAQGPRRSGYPIDLQEEESRGGHAIAEHVGKSEAFLLEGVREAARALATGGYGAGGLRSGSFPSLEAANKLVNATLSQNPEKVDLVVNGSLPIAVLEAEFGSPTGYEAYARSERSQPYMRETYSVRVIIVRDPSSDRKFRVLTAFPINPDR
jgi:hypothetical protein